jgi:tetratricopeptide (TPR) repeat protein
MPNDLTPFVGPRPFKREDAPLFFGRTDEADELRSLVVADREVLLYAQSGAGKTSLLNAGLRPLLEAERVGFEVLPVARVRYESPEEIETRQVANVYIFNVLAGWCTLAHNVRQLNTMTLADFLNELPGQLDKEGSPRPRLLIFDQFEELFTFYPERASDRRGFFEQVRDALNKNRLLRVIFSMREEYIAELTPYAPILPEKLRTRFRLERLREPAALQAVTGPLTSSRFSFAPGVAEKVVQDLLQVNVGNKTHAVRGEYVEPVQLQVVCEALCRHLPRNVSVITLDDLQHFGNVNEALANFYKDCLKETTRATHVWGGARRLRKWFARALITPEGVRDAIRQGPTKTRGLPNRAVGKLEELHLIRGEERPGRGRWYELTHDTFIGPIQEVNRIADRRMHLFQSIAASAALVVLVAACIVLYQSYWRYQKVSAFMTLGVQRANAGKYEDAVKQFEQALEIAAGKSLLLPHRFDPLCRSAHLQAAFNLLMLGHYDQAASHYEVALTIKPDNADGVDRKEKDFQVRLTLGYIYEWKGESAEAGDADVFFDKARAEMEEASNLNPASADPDIVCGKIEANREKGRKGRDYSEAAANYYREAIKKNPESRDAYIGLAEVHLYRYEADGAIGDATMAVTLGFETADTHKVLGEAFFWKGNYDEAAAELNRAIGLQSNDSVSHCRLADVYYAKERYELAKIEYEQAQPLAAKSANPGPLIAWASCGLGYIALKQHKWDVAASHFNKALDSDPKNYIGRFGRALLFSILKEPGKAEADWKKALELCDESDRMERMERIIYKVALGTPGSVDEMNSMIREHPPIGMMDGALDDADLLVAFKINPAESEKVREVLVKAIEEARNQPAGEE